MGDIDRERGAKGLLTKHDLDLVSSSSGREQAERPRRGEDEG
jgi:hypothetical protein